MAALRPAQFIVATMEVICPYCGEPLPSPDGGSHLWTPSEVKPEEGPKKCGSCDKPFRLLTLNSARIET